jgi:hypothetical protein
LQERRSRGNRPDAVDDVNDAWEQFILSAKGLIQSARKLSSDFMTKSEYEQLHKSIDALAAKLALALSDRPGFWKLIFFGTSRWRARHESTLLSHVQDTLALSTKSARLVKAREKRFHSLVHKMDEFVDRFDHMYTQNLKQSATQDELKSINSFERSVKAILKRPKKAGRRSFLSDVGKLESELFSLISEHISLVARTMSEKNMPKPPDIEINEKKRVLRAGRLILEMPRSGSR